MKNRISAVGKRKTSIAVSFLDKGKGKIFINDKSIDDISNSFFKSKIDYLKQPLVLTGNEKNYDINITVYGGGINGQVDAIRLSIARLLLKVGADKLILKSNGLLTRDSRKKERKKYGLKGARRAPQFSKR